MMESPAKHARTIETLAIALEQLQVRNQRLEAEAKRIKLLFMVLCLFGGTGLLFYSLAANQAEAAAQAAPKTLRANAFIIVDRSGNERGNFGYNDAEQAAYLNLESDKGGRVSLSMSHDGVGLRLTHAKNDINLGCTAKGGTYLEMFDKDGKSIFEQRKP